MPVSSRTGEILLTIAVPTFNGKSTIGRMLDLLLPQIDEQVEVLISDNCSDEESVSVMNDYLKRYPLISYTRNEYNIGADSNFLQCMRLAKGKYMLLLSDDDILVEESLQRILSFLRSNQDMGLVYLSTANFYIKYKSKHDCVFPISTSINNVCTSDKKLFMEYAHHYWGFVSSFIILRKNFEEIDNPEQYFGTYWLQSYIHILCASSSRKTKVGIVADLCVAAGVYLQQSNLDTALVDGVNYKNMLEFAIQNGFDEIQLNDWYIRRICLLASHSLVKEKATGNKKINRKLLYSCTYKYWQAWIKIYPFYFVPKILCRIFVGIKRKRYGANYRSSINRDGDVGS